MKKNYSFALTLAFAITSVSSFATPPYDASPKVGTYIFKDHLPYGAYDQRLEYSNSELELAVKKFQEKDNSFLPKSIVNSLKAVLDFYTGAPKSKSKFLQEELDRIQDPNQQGEILISKNYRKIRSYNTDLFLKRNLKLEESIKAIIDQMKDERKFKENLKATSPLEPFLEATKDVKDKDWAVQQIELMYDQAILGEYTRRKLERLLDSKEFCERASACAKTGGEPDKSHTSKLKGMFEPEVHKDEPKSP